MNFIFKLIMIPSALLCWNSSYAKITFYCAPANAITITQQTGQGWPYLYTTQEETLAPGVIQPALTGWGDAAQSGPFYSAVWTDGALACNYSPPDFIVLMSVPLGISPTCNFPSNGGKEFCNSADPSQCPLVCT